MKILHNKNYFAWYCPPLYLLIFFFFFLQACHSAIFEESRHPAIFFLLRIFSQNHFLNFSKWWLKSMRIPSKISEIAIFFNRSLKISIRQMTAKKIMNFVNGLRKKSQISINDQGKISRISTKNRWNKVTNFVNRPRKNIGNFVNRSQIKIKSNFAKGARKKIANFIKWFRKKSLSSIDQHVISTRTSWIGYKISVINWHLSTSLHRVV